MKENCSPKFTFPSHQQQHNQQQYQHCQEQQPKLLVHQQQQQQTALVPKKRIFIDPVSLVSLQPPTRRAALAPRNNIPHEWNLPTKDTTQIQNHSLPLPSSKDIDSIPSFQHQQQYNQQQISPEFPSQSRRIFTQGAASTHFRKPSETNHNNNNNNNNNKNQKNNNLKHPQNHHRGNSQGTHTAATLFKAIFSANSTKNYLAQQTSFQNPGDVQCSYEDDESICKETNDHLARLAAFKRLSHLKIAPKPETAARFTSNIQIFSKITEFIGFADLLNLQNVCKTFATYSYQRHVRRQLHQYIQKGLTSAEVYALWDSQIHFNSVQSRHELQFYNFTLLPSNCDADIIQDSNRTLLSRAEPFEGKKKEKLKKILRSICHNVKDVGYVRGMNEIVGGLLASNIFKENETYWIVLFVLRRLKLKDLFTQGFPRLNILCFQLQIFMQNYTSDLLNFLQRHDIPVISFAAKWFLTIFASEFPQDLLMQVWNMLLIRGHKALIQVSIGLLKLFENDIMSCTSTEGIIALLKNLTPARSIQEQRATESLLELSKQMKITNRMLSSLEKIFELHPSYLRETLTIMLFRNRHLNNAYDWKILPQAPDFSGPNSTLERLNAHTMVADYFNELSAIESQRQKSTQQTQPPFGQKPHVLPLHSRSLSLNRGALLPPGGGGAIKPQALNNFSSDSKLQLQQQELAAIPNGSSTNTHLNQTSNQGGILKQISKKLISIFSDDQSDDQQLQHQQSQSQQQFGIQNMKSPIHNELNFQINPIAPPNTTATMTGNAAPSVQTSLQYFDQILGEMKEVLQDRNNFSFEDQQQQEVEQQFNEQFHHNHSQQHQKYQQQYHANQIIPSKRAHNNHQGTSNQIKQCLRRDESFSDLNELENTQFPCNQTEKQQQQYGSQFELIGKVNSIRRSDGFDEHMKSLRATSTTMVSSSLEGITNCSSKHSSMHMMKTLLPMQPQLPSLSNTLPKHHQNPQINPQTQFPSFHQPASASATLGSASSRMLPPKIPTLHRAETTPVASKNAQPQQILQFNDASFNQRQYTGSSQPASQQFQQQQQQHGGWTLIRK